MNGSEKRSAFAQRGLQAESRGTSRATMNGSGSSALASRKAAQNARADREANADSAQRDRRAAWRADIPRKRAREPSSAIAMATANGPSLALMNICP